MSSDSSSSDEKIRRQGMREKIARRDPLALLGVAVLIVGIGLGVYGLIPFTQAQYQQVASGPVPITDSSNNFIINPELYFQQHYSGSGSLDRVLCSPSINGWFCYGYQFIGTKIVYSKPAQEFGVGMLGLGFVAVYGSTRLPPAPPKPKHLRPITIRVDEDVCVANGVCVALAPSVFQLKKQDTPTIFAPMAYVVDPTSADNDTIIQAAEMCPTGAIIIEDAETGERIHPPLPET